MVLRPRIVLTGIALAVAVFLGLTFWHQSQRAALIGLTDRACTAEGRSVTGSDFDDWAALCAYREDNLALANAPSPEVVMIGDSLTERWPGQTTGIVKRGVGGQSSAQVLLRFRQDALSLKPRIVHILLGTNDLLGLNGPFTIEQFEGNVLNMTELARLHGAVVVLGTVPPMRDFAGYKPGDPAPDVASLNTVLRKLAQTHGFGLADYHSVLVRPDGTRREELFGEDGLHLTAEGYRALQPVFDDALRRARKTTDEPLSAAPDQSPGT
ncbi:GDSL-type esterase/lipase family protein [Novosphingobium malaysiense]|uniref:GDSL-type esterase/lipase family protein n=1 Tax=Novosphingobium malaysiense TaxID=1348853 RepID=UPI0006895FF7|nr:GDSL-type esterase/lipase family protein [Novosphingobium malaysiense]